MVHLGFLHGVVTPPSDLRPMWDRKSQEVDVVSNLYMHANLRRVQNTGSLSESLADGVTVGVNSGTSSDVDPCPRWRILSPLVVLSV